MGWIWRLEAADGTVLDSIASPAHPNQSDAESWLGEQWRALAADGVARVTLLEDGVEIYGPMPLN
ncbi:MAG: hypothetical protein QOG80_2617 [Pseudonocardiales bacterium]|jgi:hypothetical protein|nr:hypothetical protein [Pseudonocardiales bacterium]